MDNQLENADNIKKYLAEIKKCSASIVETVRDPLLVLDADLRVVCASRSFCHIFKVSQKETSDQLIYNLGNGQWNIPKLRKLLEEILPQENVFNDFEVEHDFEHLGKRIMYLNARQIYLESTSRQLILLAIEDVTDRIIAKRAAAEAKEYVDSIITTVRDPFLVLDSDLRVLSASRSFYQTFEATQEETEGQLIYDLGNRQWDIPKLRELLENILPQSTSFNDFEVEHDFEHIGKRIMYLNARKFYRETNRTTKILLAIEDVTERRKIENELKKRADESRSMVNLMAGREVRMAELKKVIEALHLQLEEAGMKPVADEPLKEV